MVLNRQPTAVSRGSRYGNFGLRLEPEGLLGGEMSGTRARALGPLGAVVFGLPVHLGLGVDAIRTLTSVLSIWLCWSCCSYSRCT